MSVREPIKTPIWHCTSIVNAGDPIGLVEFVDAEFGYALEHPMGRTILSEQAQLDAASQGAGLVPVTDSFDGEFAKAESRGDYQKTPAIKGHQVEGWFRS